MSESAKAVTRQELYDQVWSTPLVKLAVNYGVSDVALAKACKRLNVPRPPPGYWTQIASGRRIKKPALPKKDEDTPESTTIGANRPTIYSATGESVVTGVQKIVVPDDLRGCHPLISATRKSLESSKPQENQLLHAVHAGTLSVAVSRSSMHRALRIMEAIIVAAEAFGWKVESPGERGGTQITPENVPVSLELIEKVDRSEKERPPNVQYWYKTYSYAPTGHLVIRITNYLDNGMRRSWSDGKLQRLENVLPEVFAGVKLAAEHLQKRRLEFEERERQWAEERRKREELEKRVKIEKERRDQLELEMVGWQKAKVIRGFCDALQARAQNSPDEFPAESTNRWLAWARALASKHDPFENRYIQKAIQDENLDPNLDCEKRSLYW